MMLFNLNSCFALQFIFFFKIKYKMVLILIRLHELSITGLKKEIYILICLYVTVTNLANLNVA